MTPERPQSKSTTDEDALWELIPIADDQELQRRLDEICSRDITRRQRLMRLLECRPEAERLFGPLDERADEHGASITDTPNAHSGDGGKRIGNYELIRLVGRGGMGNVFQAYDVRLDRQVAIKIPRLDFLGAPGIEHRFLREARAAARLDHPHLVSVFEVGTDGPFPFIASQWCNEGDLGTWMRAHPPPRDSRAAARFLAKIADAMHHCHERGLVHLDLKPSNILLSLAAEEPSTPDSLDDLNPLVSDFGLARLIENQLDKTSQSMFLGTPLYMSPEQAECRREMMGPRTDLFALGVILHELVTGRRPFEGETVVEVIDQIRDNGWKDRRRLQGVSSQMTTIIERCLQPEPSDRYASASALADDLRRFATDRPIAARPVAPWRRLSLWCRRPERIVQAAVITIAVQLAVYGTVYGHFLLLGLGLPIPSEINNYAFFKETLPVALFLHLPLLINGIRTRNNGKFSVLIGTILSIVFVAFLSSVVATGNSPFTVYQGNPVATYAVHLLFCTMAVVQLSAHVVAIPAAWKRG